MSTTLFSKYLKKKKANDHAVFSASGAERWLGCAGSIQLSEGIPSVETPAGIRGTNTHTVLQFILENSNWKRLINTPEGVRFRLSIGYDSEMLINALFAANYVWDEIARLENKHGKGFNLYIEKKVHLKGVGFGTSDVIIHKPFSVLSVMDYKNGKKLVEAENNDQMNYYAIASADEFNWEFSEAHLTIIQPNASHSKGQVRKSVTDEKKLEYANNRFLKGVALAKKKDAPLVKKDSWCFFCPARAKCPLQKEIKDQKLFERFNAYET